MSQSETGTLATNESVMKQFRIASLITAVLILVQAALAGRGRFVDHDLIQVHGYVGNNATFIVAIGLLGIAFNGYKRGSSGPDRSDHQCDHARAGGLADRTWLRWAREHCRRFASLAEWRVDYGSHRGAARSDTSP